MNWDAIEVWVDILQFAWIIVATIWVFWGNRDKEVRVRVDANATEISELSERLTRVEEASRYLPTHRDLGEVYEKLEAINGGLQGVNGEMKALRAQVELITKHMLNSL